MAGHKIAHATLKGPSVVKELVIGLALGLAAGGLWKMHHWNEQRKTRAFYDLLERGEIVLTNRYGGADETLSLLYCHLYLRQFKETLKQTMLEQESVSEDQIHELHRLYQRQKELMMEMESRKKHSLVKNSSVAISMTSVLPPEGDEPAEIDEAEFLGDESDYERAEQEMQDPLISTKSQAENGIDLDRSRLQSEEVTTSLKTVESEQRRESVSASLQGKLGTEPSRSIVLALPCLEHISLFHNRSSCSRKKAKPKQTLSRSKARRGSKNGNHSQEHLRKGSASSLPEAKSARNLTKPGKKRLGKPQKEPDKVMRKIARTKSKTRGSFLVTEEEEQEEKSAAAESLVALSLSESGRRKSSIETSDCITPLHWFAKIASLVVEDSKNELGLSATGFHSDYQTNTSVSTNTVHPKRKRTPRSQRKRKRQQHEYHYNEIHPRLRTFTGNEASQDLSKIGRLVKVSETKDTQCSLMENMIIDWGILRKRSRGIRTPSANTKTP
ncbi:unnamed protein product [Microthlaspi erraticum]|uniref:Cytochrome c oxidase subunit 5C n=1 Tax=Microthlaspi erraticum TaxID=1685480 RepID=A0A6D2I6G0_9BRAS|nr:unnamed protein product [Microthlaspi erraticum]